METTAIVTSALRCAICISFAIVCVATARRVSILGALGFAAAALLDLAQEIGFDVMRARGPVYGAEWFELERTIHILSIACNLVTAGLFAGSLVMIRLAHSRARSPGEP